MYAYIYTDLDLTNWLKPVAVPYILFLETLKMC